ncbi:MAG: TrmJ/YjtD family RNA methyltransferase [Promethearchaeota archaeon]|nr:MAG: TrmJ/YjtD family RNA methyltransferase [Candidatus Lokiarchaeota archaeon]
MLKTKRARVRLNKKKIHREINNFQETYLDEKYRNITFEIVLVSPETAGNIGSIARVMKNFNFRNLVIFNPMEEASKILSYEAQGYAMHGKDILLNSEIITIDNQKNHIPEFKKYLKKFDLVIATTAKGKRYTNIKRLAIFPEDLSIPYSKNIAILFGKESRGLTNEEIKLADIILRIPTGNEYPALNLSHACAIILYELFKKIYVVKIGRGEKPVLLADKEDRNLLYSFVKDLIEKLKIRSHKEENVYFAFQNVFERAFMSKKELSLITGLFSKLNSVLKDIKLYEKR